jgi:lysophospholipase L1-like esterase
MKNTISNGIRLILFSLATAVAVAAPVDVSKYPQAIRVACVGDSITQGSDAERGKAYPGQLQEMLGDKWSVRNFGVSGRTLLKKGDHPYWSEKAYQQALDFAPDVVVIMLGTNDTKPANWGHFDEFYADYKELVKSFKLLKSKPLVYVCRPCPVPGTGNYGINETNLLLEIPLIDKLAREENLGVIDMHAALVAKPLLMPDRVHPNTEGARVMAGTVYHELTGRTPPPD